MNDAMENFVARVCNIEPKPGDTVTITIFHPDQDPEKIDAVWLGISYCVSLGTPFIKFISSDIVRFVNSRFILEVGIKCSTRATEYLDKN